MRFLMRWTADAVAIYLALYLVDSVSRGRFLIEAGWVAVILALLLGLLNSFVRPLRRVRTKPTVALVTTVVAVLVNALVIQAFVWGKLSLATTGFVWTLATAAFVSLLAGCINWLIGFKAKEKPRPTARMRSGQRGSSTSRDGRGRGRPA